MLRESLALRPATHPGRIRVLENLISALEIRSKESDAQSDLTEATTSLRQDVLVMS